MNIKLFLFLVIIETLLVIMGFYLLVLIFFLYFGTGAEATSDKTLLIENIWFVILFSTPLLFGIIKFRNIKEKFAGNAYLYSGLLVTIVSGIYFGLNV